VPQNPPPRVLNSRSAESANERGRNPPLFFLPALFLTACKAYDAAMKLPDQPLPTRSRSRASTIRKIVIVAVLGLLVSLVAAYDAGYAIWIGGGATGESRGNLTLLSCTYFTGKERVINRIWQPIERGDHCAFVTKIAKASNYTRIPLN
jgi:hypothetical protein